MNTAEFDTRLRHQRRLERPEQPRLQAVTTAPIAITVQTTDRALGEAIRAAAGSQHPVSIASSMDEALQLAAEGKCGILITDQALTQNALVQVGKQMRAHDPATITIAVGSRGDDNALIGLLSSAVVERFMLKPVTPSLARLVIRSAASEYQSLKYRTRRGAAAPKFEPHDPQSGEPVVVSMPSGSAAAKSGVSVSHAPKPAEVREETRVAPASVVVEPRVATPLAEPTPPRSGPASHVWLIAAAAALVVGGAVWWTMQSRIPDIDPRQVVATNLAAAKQALDDDRYVHPLESSALHYYSVVLSLDAANADARRGMEAVASRMTEDVKLAIVDGRLAEAGIARERLRRISPDNRRLALLDSELRKEQANQISRLQAPPPTLTVQKPAPEPAASTRVTSKNTKSTKLPAAAEPLVAEPEPTLLAASSAVVAGSTMTASPLDMGPPAPGVTSSIPTSSIPGASAAGKSASVDAAIAPLSAPVAANPQPAIPADPKLVKVVQPAFPRDARERSVEGWVDVTLAVTAAGDVASARVNSSENGRFFERAALTAVKQWRYEPRPLADPEGTQPVQVRVSFKLQD
jgi:protein TonB